MIALLHHEFQVGTASHHDTTDVRLVVRNEVLRGQLTTLDNVEVALLFSKTRETHGRLTTATMLLRQLDRHSLNNLFVVALERRKEHAITVDDNETKLVIVLQERKQRLRFKTVLASVAEHVNGPERLKGVLNLFLSVSVLLQNDTAEDDKTVRWDVLVQLELLSRRCDRCDDRLACLTRLDVFGARQLLRQQLHVLVERIAGWNVQRHERGSIASCALKLLDQPFDFPLLDMNLVSLRCFNHLRLNFQL